MMETVTSTYVVDSQEQVWMFVEVFQQNSSLYPEHTLWMIRFEMRCITLSYFSGNPRTANWQRQQPGLDPSQVGGRHPNHGWPFLEANRWDLGATIPTTSQWGQERQVVGRPIQVWSIKCIDRLLCACNSVMMFFDKIFSWYVQEMTRLPHTYVSVFRLLDAEFIWMLSCYRSLLWSRVDGFLDVHTVIVQTCEPGHRIQGKRIKRISSLPLQYPVYLHIVRSRVGGSQCISVVCRCISESFAQMSKHVDWQHLGCDFKFRDTFPSAYTKIFTPLPGRQIMASLMVRIYRRLINEAAAPYYEKWWCGTASASTSRNIILHRCNNSPAVGVQFKVSHTKNRTQDLLSMSHGG